MPESNPSATFPVIAGGEGAPAEPNWTAIYRLKIDRELAHEHWRNIVEEMKSQGTLSIVHGPAIKRLVMFQIEFDRVARDLGKRGVVRKAVRTKVPLVHPSWTVMKQAAEAAAAHEAELSLSPRRRKNVGRNKKPEAGQTPASRYLRPVSR